MKLKHSFARVRAAEYIRDFRDAERFIGYCRACENYGAMWMCPPYGFEPLECISGYEYVHIIGTQVFIDEATRFSAGESAQLAQLSRRIMAAAREQLDGRLLELEKRYAGSRAFFAGSCLLCGSRKAGPHEEAVGPGKGACARQSGEPCRHPAEARTSLEAYGFDLSKTASELLGIPLQWSAGNVLPEYLTLISGVFSKCETIGDIMTLCRNLPENSEQQF